MIGGVKFPVGGGLIKLFVHEAVSPAPEEISTHPRGSLREVVWLPGGNLALLEQGGGSLNSEGGDLAEQE